MKKLFAEFLGTFFLMIAGTGAIVINESSQGAITHSGVAFAFGAVIFIGIMLFGPVSGAHFNPAVTLTQFFRKKHSLGDTGTYLLAQLAGAFAGSLLLHELFPANQLLGTTLPAGSETQSFIFEFLLTFLLMLAILRTSESELSLAVVALVVGGTVFLEALFAGPVCGASMNPARSLAPALVSGHTEHLWIYISAPLIGAFTAAFVNLTWEKKKQI